MPPRGRVAGAREAKVDGLTVITRDGDVLTEYVLRGGSGAGRSKLELVAERDAAQEKLVEVTTAIERSRSRSPRSARRSTSPRSTRRRPPPR